MATAIDNISYTVDNNDASDSDGFRVDADSCASLAGHSSCALKFTTPRLSTQGANVHGSAVLKASYHQNGALAMAQQLINYTLLPAPATLAAMTDVNLQAYQFGTIYLYAKNGNYNLESMTASIPELTETNRSSQVLDAPQVVAVEILATNIDKPQSVKLDLQYQDQQSQTNTLQSIVTATPYADGAYLTAGQVPVINTATGTSGQMQVYNSGNAAATLGNISADNNGITILTNGSNRCVSSASLAAHSSCTVYFTVPQAANNGTLTVAYDTSGSLQQQVTWYNGVDQALLQMVVNPASVTAYQNYATNPITVTLQNIGGYDITALTVLPGANTNSGSATTTTSTALSCLASDGTTSTGTTLKVDGSCSYAITIRDTVAETNKNMLLGISGSYTGSAGAATYSRKAILAYTTKAPGAVVTITPVTNWQTIMGSAYVFKATIANGSSTVTPSVSGLTGSISISPTFCALSSTGTASCNFIVTPYSGSGYYSYWNPTSIPTSTDVNTATTAYNYPTASLSVAATGTNTIINGNASPQTFSLGAKVTAPYVYLQAPVVGAASATNTGITYGSGGTVSSRFTTVSSNCVTDNLTGLMWVKDLDTVNGGVSLYKNEAVALADSGTWCGYSDWRLPTINELNTLINYGAVLSGSSPSAWLNTQGFANVAKRSVSYFSSSFGGSSTSFMLGRFDSGSIFVGSPSGGSCLWPVRGGQ